MDYTWKFNFTRTPGMNISSYKDFNTSPTKQMGTLVCFGNSSTCGEYLPYYDAYTDDCYIASTCPLPVFTGWNFTTLCPNCTQLVCDKCDSSDRSLCSVCKPNTNTRLSGTACICDTNYLPVTHPIDTASSGLWNNLTPSLLSCKLNCSAVIPGCLQNDCANASFCTVCLTASNYVLLVHNTTDQSCVLCNLQIVRCTTCANSSHCSVCSDGSYLLSSVPTGSCPLCSSAMSHCTNCTDGSICTLCELGYLVNPTTKKCDCDETYNLLNCQSCTVAGQCDACATLHFLNSTTLKCQPCSDIHSSCTACSDENTCTSCSSGSALDSTTFPGSVKCKVCVDIYPSCTACSDENTCTECSSGSALDSTTFPGSVKCKACVDIHPSCTACSDEKTCTACSSGSALDSTTFPGSVKCKACVDIHPSCTACSDENTCTSCSQGYALDSATLPGSVKCRECRATFDNCKWCSSSTVCTTCDPGFNLNLATVKCDCDHTFNALSHCQSCLVPQNCHVCVALYFLNSTTLMCRPCSDIHSSCTACSDEKTCTACSSGSALDSTTFPGSVKCKVCVDIHPSCTACSDENTCTSCSQGYALDSATLPGSVKCRECRATFDNCKWCSSSTVCTTCDPGFNLNLATVKCDCDHTFNALSHCQSCLVPQNCHVCVALYFLNSTTLMCRPCSDIHSSCTDCSEEKTCTSCSAGFALDSVAKSGSVTCRECGKFINNCTFCSSSSVCTDCDFFYGLEGPSCKICNQLLMPGCESCETSALCLTCDSQTRMIDSICHYCDEVINCVDCIVHTNILWCTVCKKKYFISSPSTTSIPRCKSCQNVCSFCTDCISPTQCIQCLSPYLIGPTGLCDQCQSGYEFTDGFCLKQAGCMTLVIRDGKEICLGCATQLNFVLDTKLMKCVCNVGYEESHQIGSLMKCVPICGDGIVLPKDEDCDDKNTENDDGCDSECRYESGFQCSSGPPTSCVLSHIVNEFQYNYVMRDIPKNKATFSFRISPSVKAFKKLKWQNLINLQFFSEKAVKKNDLAFSYSMQTNQLLVTAPYHQELQNTILQASLKLDPTIIKSSKRQYFLDGKLINGKNMPLTFDSQSMQSTSENVQTISMILIVLVMVQFYIGSCIHKMIGLQTIQIIQTLYFSRMIVSASSTSLLQSLNNIQYSATGYQNSDLIFGENMTKLIQSQSYDTISPQFTSINLQKYFFLNINFALIPVLIVLAIFLIKLRRKISGRNLYMETKDPEMMDKYTQLRRSCQWVYDHTVFPFLMMFNMVGFFQNVLYFTSTRSESQSSESKDLQIASYPVQMLLLIATVAIYCFEIFTSYEEFKQYGLTQKQRQRMPVSAVEKLQYDQNYIGRANYHPLYVLIYSIYYLLLQLSLVFGVMFKDFQYSLQLVLGISGFYFLLICFWKPYHRSINAHNHFLKINHGTVVAFLSICYVMAKVKNLSPDFYKGSMYAILGLVGCVVSGGFLRIWIQIKFRKSLQADNTLLSTSVDAKQKQVKKQNKTKEQKPLLPKNFGLVAKNPYYFPNQLKQLSKKYGLKPQGNVDKLTMQEEICVIQKIRQQNRFKKQNNYADDIQANSQQNHNRCIFDESIQSKLIQTKSKESNPVERIRLEKKPKQILLSDEPCIDALKEQIETSSSKSSSSKISAVQIDEKQILRRLKNRMRLELKNNFF